MTTDRDKSNTVAHTPGSEFVLLGKYDDGRPKYFRFWTAIGPCATPDIDEAERFPSAQAAMQSPGYSHWSSFYEPSEISAARAAIQRAGGEQ